MTHSQGLSSPTLVSYLAILGVKVELKVENVLLPGGALGAGADKEDLVGPRNYEPQCGAEGDV